MDALWIALGVVFVAELGDKSQLMTLTFAARYRPSTVFVAISLATAAIHAVSVSVGEAVSRAIPTDVITIVAGVMFLGFAAWTIRDGDEDEDEDEGGGDEEAAPDEPGSRRSPLVVIGATFFLAELGDKTMLASMTLASTNGWLGTWVGATVGMVAANVLAILVGANLGARLPMRLIRIGSAALFAVFGVVLIVSELI